MLDIRHVLALLRVVLLVWRFAAIYPGRDYFYAEAMASLLCLGWVRRLAIAIGELSYGMVSIASPTLSFGHVHLKDFHRGHLPGVLVIDVRDTDSAPDTDSPHSVIE